MFDTIVYFVSLVVGIAGLGYGLVEFRRALDSKHWLVREAEVLDSRIDEHRGGITGTRYSPFLCYEYRHDGLVYKGKRIMFSGLGLTSSREKVEEFLVPFAQGTHIAVHVSPRDPRVSVIEPGVDRRLKLMLFGTSYFILIGVGGFLGWWK